MSYLNLKYSTNLNLIKVGHFLPTVAVQMRNWQCFIIFMNYSSLFTNLQMPTVGMPSSDPATAGQFLPFYFSQQPYTLYYQPEHFPYMLPSFHPQVPIYYPNYQSHNQIQIKSKPMVQDFEHNSNQLNLNQKGKSKDWSQKSTAIFQCDKCSNILSSQKSLNYHAIDVHGPKKYRCESCDNGFSTQSRLNRHSCRLGGTICRLCDKKAANMKKHHYNNHTQISCKVCKEIFTGYDKLTKHQKKVHFQHTEKAKHND